MGEEEFEQLWRSLDHDGDGGINLREFVWWWRLGLDMPVHQLHPMNDVAYSMDIGSLWAEEVKAVEKQDDGVQGICIQQEGRLVIGGRVTRSLIQVPGTGGVRQLSTIDEWVQAVVRMADLTSTLAADYTF